MTNDGTNISIRAYAKSLGISDKAVRNAIKDERIKKGVTYDTQTRNGVEIEVPMIIPKIADKEFGNLYKTGKTKPGQDKVKKVEATESKLVEKPVKKSALSPQFDEETETEDAALSAEDEELISSMKITKSMSIGEATRRREIIGLVMDKNKLQLLEGSLVKRSDVEKALFAFGDEFKKALLNLPGRVTAEVRGANNEVEAQTIMAVEITEILNRFANLQELKLTL